MILSYTSIIAFLEDNANCKINNQRSKINLQIHWNFIYTYIIFLYIYIHCCFFLIFLIYLLSSYLHFPIFDYWPPPPNSLKSILSLCSAWCFKYSCAPINKRHRRQNDNSRECRFSLWNLSKLFKDLVLLAKVLLFKTFWN